MRTQFILCLGLVALPVSAQEASGKVRRFSGRLGSVELDLASGTLTRGASARARNASTTATFRNLDLGGFVGIDTGSCQVEWYDAGVKSAGRSTFVSGFTTAYCSSALDPMSGGPGGSVELSFRTGYVNGTSGHGATQPVPGTEVARILLTGLPANTGNSSFFGGFRCFFLTVRMDATFCLPDGDIGYGWKFIDRGTPGVRAQTGPFLSCVTSCTPGGVGPDGQGMVDGIDQYSPPGIFRRNFWYGCAFSPCSRITSIALELRELDSTGALPQAIYTGSNLAVLDDRGGTIGFGPNLADPGEPYALGLDCSAATGGGSYRIDLRPNLVAAGIPTGFGLLAATGPVLAKFTGVHLQGTVTTPTLLVPKDVSFACLAYTNQGWCQSSPKGFLSNAIRETIGVP